MNPKKDSNADSNMNPKFDPEWILKGILQWILQWILNEPSNWAEPDAKMNPKRVYFSIHLGVMLEWF